jgi:hypothetical protein
VVVAAAVAEAAVAAAAAALSVMVAVAIGCQWDAAVVAEATVDSCEHPTLLLGVARRRLAGLLHAGLLAGVAAAAALAGDVLPLMLMMQVSGRSVPDLGHGMQRTGLALAMVRGERMAGSRKLLMLIGILAMAQHSEMTVYQLRMKIVVTVMALTLSAAQQQVAGPQLEQCSPGWHVRT